MKRCLGLATWAAGFWLATIIAIPQPRYPSAEPWRRSDCPTAGALTPSALRSGDIQSVPYWTAVGHPPAATLGTFRIWLDQLVAYRIGECPLDQPTTYYFSTSGDDAQDGLTPQTAKKTLTEAQAILDATPNPAHLRLRFRCGDEWITNTGLYVHKDYVSIDTYGTGDKPTWSRFTQTFQQGWTLHSGTTYVRNFKTRLGWLYDETLGWEQPFYRGSSVAAINTIPSDCPGSFFHDPVGKLYVNLGGINPNTLILRGVPANDIVGVNMAGHGGRLEGLRLIGFGLNPDNTSNQAAGIKVTKSQSGANLVVDCESYYCSSHAMHFNGGGHLSDQGGIATFVGCRAGFTQRNSSGETVYNSFVSGGLQETIFRDCVAAYGTLPDDQWYEEGAMEVRGRSFFSHTAWNKTRLIVVDGGVVPDNRFGCAGNALVADSQTAGDIAGARAFVIAEDFRQSRPGAQIDIALAHGARVGCVYQAVVGHYGYRAWTNGKQSKGWTANCHFDIDATFIPAGTVAMYNGFSSHSVRVEHCDFVFRVRNGHKVRIPDYDQNFSLSTKWHNCVFAVVGTPTSLTVGFGSPQLSNNGYYNTDGQAGTDPTPVWITDPAELDENFFPVAGSASYVAGTTPLFWVELDRFNTPRHGVPSLGDVEHGD